MSERELRAGAVVVVGGVVFEVAYAIAGTPPGPIPLLVALSAVALTTAAVLRKRTVALGWLTAVLLAADFGGAVADRFGLLGDPGTSGVTWGDWSAFTTYTGTLVPWLPHALVAPLAVGATTTEVALCGWLLSGVARRWAGRASAVVLAAFFLAMLTSVGGAAVAKNAVPVLAGCALVLATVPVRRSADRATTAAARVPRHGAG
ncbi:hypothetical protein VSH64_10115 [Amycolatopsis rhabdoformis]|uniref:Carotenoid biosynthesis protein n=1 Tax=Amycolatopsis rhabdoformis TaxID=1448059 RepID=A0ABZ1IE77_9PSEU|nr:hypothetical protein [Amycolatopsis rhabdoformis]WSE32458.1 hypothetical protein VSH64_10115 [Amycolatopsis rhabdoformis]